MTRAVKIPLIVDADTGFGEAVNVERTVRELEAAGAAAIQIEDQRLPEALRPPVGQVAGERRRDVRQAAGGRDVAARSGAGDHRADRRPRSDVAGRGDRRGPRPIWRRGRTGSFPRLSRAGTNLTLFSREIDAPLVANMTEFGKSPLLSLEELANLGYAGVLYPVTALRVAMKAVEAALAVIDQEGTQAELLDLMQTREELYELLEYDEYEQRDQKYFSGGNDECRSTNDERNPNDE